MKTPLFKKCLNQKCKFDRCWIKAPRCEKCGYDFNLKRMPRKPKPIILPEEDDEPLPLPPPVTDTHKPCPSCNNRCWYKAKFCDKCQYNFVEGSTVKNEIGVEPEPPKKEERVFIGYRPIFPNLEVQPWMDDFVGPSTNLDGLRHWAGNFLRQLARYLAPGQADFHVCSDCVVDWAASYSKNPHIREAKHTLHEWYKRKAGISQWVQVNESVEKGYLLTNEETATVYRDAEISWRGKIAVDMILTHGNGQRSIYTSFLSPDSVPAFRSEAEKKGHRYLSYGDKQYRSLRLLPPEWDDLDDAAQSRWAHRLGIPGEPLPKRTAKSKRVKS